MTQASTLEEPTPLAEFTARSTDQLAILTAFAMDLARLARDTADRLAVAHPVEASERLPPLTKAFDRLARTTRQCIALEGRLHAGPICAARPIFAARTAAQSYGRRQLVRRVEDIIETKVPPPERENLLRDLYERLEDPGIDDDLATRPLDVVIHQLRGDLGLIPGTRPRTAADIRTLNHRAAGHPSPTAAPHAAPGPLFPAPNPPFSLAPGPLWPEAPPYLTG